MRYLRDTNVSVHVIPHQLRALLDEGPSERPEENPGTGDIGPGLGFLSTRVLTHLSWLEPWDVASSIPIGLCSQLLAQTIR